MYYILNIIKHISNKGLLPGIHICVYIFLNKKNIL